MDMSLLSHVHQQSWRRSLWARLTSSSFALAQLGGLTVVRKVVNTSVETLETRASEASGGML
jgi:hypothetical protein